MKYPMAWFGLISVGLIALGLSLGLGGCGSGNDSLAGTDAGNTSKVAGILTDMAGRPIAARLVQLRTATFQGNFQDSLVNRPALGKEWTDSTGPTGAFSFLLGPTDTGSFVCEALLNEVEGVRFQFRREQNQGVELGKLKLHPVGGISGKVHLPDGAIGSILITLLGTHQTQYFIDGNGDFAFYSLPPGKYSIRVEGLAPIRAAVDTSISVPSGATLTGLSLMPGSAQLGSTGQIALQLKSPRPLVGILKAKLEASGNSLSADSNGALVFKDVPSGMQTILAWGESPFRDTLRISGIQVNAGQQTEPPPIQFKIKALIVDGIANHDWLRMTRYNKAILESTGLFHVSVSTTPPDNSSPIAWSGWHPRFSDFDVLILECNSGYPDDGKANPWPDSIKRSLEEFVSGGGGLVNTHATFPGFYGWPAFDEMHGLNWRNVDITGPSFELDSLNALVPNPTGLNQASYDKPNSGVNGEYLRVADTSHPITYGLPLEWRQPSDSLVYQLKGNPVGMTVLAYSVSPSSGKREPQLWSKIYGTGRIFTTATGHLYPGDANIPYKCAGYQTTFTRGAEWAATGKVTTMVPKDFPGRDSTSLRGNLPN